MSEVPFAAFRAGMDEKQCSVDMTKVVGNCDILFVCLDTLRYDAAIAEEQKMKLSMRMNFLQDSRKAECRQLKVQI